jgi:GlpG protein
MRLIGTFETEKEAYVFYSFLLKEGIQNIYEPYSDEKSGAKHYRIWIYDEDDLDLATEWMGRFKQNPNDSQFENLAIPLAATPPPPNYAQVSESEELKWQPVRAIRTAERRHRFLLTHLIIVLCGALYLWNDFQEAAILKDKGPVAVQLTLTPLMRLMLFDDPDSFKYVAEAIDTFPFNNYKEEKEIPPAAKALLKQANEVPSWRGIYDFIMIAKTQGWESAREIPMFEKVRQGELWRLFTPCLLHRDFLHILFNMIWVWILLKQIEERLSKWKICLLILIIGVISNVCQYLMSGPYFLGFSGVVVGLAGFIWVRQKKAPWEGYPLQKSTILFLLCFVIAMFVLEVFMFSLQLFSSIQITPSIANTAHIVGGLVGMLLGKIAFFGRRVS